jgi:flagellar biosynthesis/type III secretory pathway protein FliH
MSKEERQTYEAHLEALRYQKSVIKTGLIEGEAKGRAEGLVEGLAKGEAKGLAEGLVKGEAKGLAEGLAKGEAKGRTEEQKKMIINSHKAGLSAKTISTITGLTLGEVNKILKQS